MQARFSVLIFKIGKRIVIFGGGPSGLFCAEQIAQARPDFEVIVIEAKRYVGRKFLVAGKSGLNLTNAASMPDFATHYSDPQQRWINMFEQFDNQSLRDWAERMGFETFESAGKKVFPKPMKSGPLLRAWMLRLAELNVEFRFRTQLSTIIPIENNRWRASLLSEQPSSIDFDIGVLAMGGASWPDTGSDGSWVTSIEKLGIETNPFEPANCGWQVDWPDDLKEQFQGQPIKNVAINFGNQTKHGELTITNYGLEGGPLYHLGPALRQQNKSVEITLDLKPSATIEQLTDRLKNVNRNYIREAKRRCKLSETAAALLKHLPQLGPWKNPDQLAKAIKACPITLTHPRPIAEAISSAGGIKWSELDEQLMLRKAGNLYAVGEMIDWEAPTGGFLLQGCFTTGFVAAKAILNEQ